MGKQFVVTVIGIVLTFSVGCASARRTGSTVKNASIAASQQVGDATSDATITSAIKMKFAADKTVDALDINVDTTDGDVTLTGKVGSKTEADQAVMLAKGVEGVKTVTPHLTLENK